MCFSAASSFAAAIPLIAGGAVCLNHALKKDSKYLAMSLMPIVVGLQQATEGFIWLVLNDGMAFLAHTLALIYMFFVWVFWPIWVPYMCASLEPSAEKRKTQMKWAEAGLQFGILLYLPHLFIKGWLGPNISQGCMAYDTIVLFDYVLPREMTAFVYLLIIAAPALLSSHIYIRYFGLMLVAFVPITYYFFVHAYLSVLCFFAAVITLFLVYVVLLDKCGSQAPYRRKSLFIRESL